MSIEIVQIQNAALKAAALEVDEAGKKDGFIDASEINLFTDKATMLLNDKKCTAQEFAAIFVLQESDKTTVESDMFAKVDSLHKAKNSEEVLPTEFGKLSQEELEDKYRDIRVKISSNNSTIKTFEQRLAQKEITSEQYYNEIGQYKFDKTLGNFGINTIGAGIGVAILGGGILAETVVGACIAIGSLGVAAVGLGILTVDMVRMFRHMDSEYAKGQEEIREAYKEGYKYAIEENEKLKPQLEELEKLL